eukprot:3062188-Pyramimonas_sp.AAC.1
MSGVRDAGTIVRLDVQNELVCRTGQDTSEFRNEALKFVFGITPLQRITTALANHLSWCVDDTF